MKGDFPMDALEPFLAKITDEDKQNKLRTLFTHILQEFPDLIPVIKWGQPMFTHHQTFILGISVSKQHFAVSPETPCLNQFTSEIEDAGYSYTENIIRIKWTEDINEDMIFKMIAFNLEDKSEVTTFWR